MTVIGYSLTKTERAQGAATYLASTYGDAFAALRQLRRDFPRKRKIFALGSDGIARPVGVEAEAHSYRMAAREFHYLSADEVRAGDMLPDKSRWPVAAVAVVPNSHVTVVHEGGYTWHAAHGGVGFGFRAVRVERRGIAPAVGVPAWAV